MISQSLSSSCDFSQILWISLPPICPCQKTIQSSYTTRTKAYSSISRKKLSRRRQNGVVWASVIPTDGRNHNLRLEFANSMTRGFKSYTVHRISDELDEDSVQLGYSNHFMRYTEDPIIDKLRTQLGAIHSIPSPPINPKISGFFVLFFVIGIVFDKLLTSRNTKNSNDRGNLGIWPQVPTSFSLFLEKDLQRKESVEWVNMVLGKLWKVYRNGLENWIISLLQPVIDNLQKPDYVERVEIKQFSLGDEPFIVRNVERRTSRDVNDLQYQIGIRYAGGARMLLMLTLKFGIIPIKVPVGVRDFDIDGELWVKLRLIPSDPWVGAVSWAFVSLPKIKFELSPFRLFNLMAIPVLSMFLKKLLTEDLPRLFVRPKKIVLDFQKEKTVGSIQNDFKPGEMQERNRDFVGELSVTLVDAQNLSCMLQGKTDPYVVLRLGDQVLRSKKNSQTTVIGAPGRPIWNQDFYMLVTNPRKQKLSIQVKDSLGFTDLTIGAGEIDLGSLKDTVPTDKIITLQGGWGPFKNRSAGEILLRLTYKAYIEDEEDERIKARIDTSRSFIDALSALILSEEFEKIVASDTTNRKSSSNLTISASDLANSESGSRGLVLLWLALITSISILIAIINIGGLNVFNL